MAVLSHGLEGFRVSYHGIPGCQAEVMTRMATQDITATPTIPRDPGHDEVPTINGRYRLVVKGRQPPRVPRLRPSPALPPLSICHSDKARHSGAAPSLELVFRPQPETSGSRPCYSAILVDALRSREGVP